MPVCLFQGLWLAQRIPINIKPHTTTKMDESTPTATVFPLCVEMDFDPTLSFLDDLDSISSFLPALEHLAPLDSHNADSSSTCTAKSVPNSDARLVQTLKPMKTYQRQKLEIESLRAQACQLNVQLQRLRQAARGAHGDDAKPSPQHESTLPHDRLWAGIAARQLEERKRAESENAKLRQALDAQMRTAQALERLLRKRLPVEVASLLEHPRRWSGHRWHDLQQRANDIPGTINSRFHELDGLSQMMKQCRLDNAGSEFEHLRTADDGVSMEMILSKTFPFPLSKVADATWQCTTSGSLQLRGGSFDGTQCSDTLGRIEVQSSVTVRRVETPLVFCGFGARHAEPSRASIVFECLGIAEASVMMNERVTLRERGYVLIEGGESPCGQPEATVNVFIRLVPECDDGRDRERRVAWLLDLAGGLYENTAASIFRGIENVLVQPSRPCPLTSDTTHHPT